MTRRRSTLHLAASVLLVTALGCLADPVAPGATIVVTAVGLAADSVLVGAPGEALVQPVVVRVTDAQGNFLSGIAVQWQVSGLNASIEDADQYTDQDGLAQGVWILGTRAVETQRLRVIAVANTDRGVRDLVAIAKPAVVASLRFLHDTSVVKLGTSVALSVEAQDPYGNVFQPASRVLQSADTSIAIVDSTGSVLPRRRGTVAVAARAGGVTATATVRVIQELRDIDFAPDSIAFAAIADSERIVFSLIDDQGLQILDSIPNAISLDTTIVQVVSPLPLLLRSVSGGVTSVLVSVGSVSRAITVAVAQIPTSIDVQSAAGKAILDAPLDSLLPLSCVARDGRGYPVPIQVGVAPSSGGRWSGSTCETLRIQHSGIDTLHLTAGSVAAAVPVALAVRPVADAPTGAWLQVDSFPTGTQPWAPSARINSHGQMEVYVALGVVGDNPVRSNLHRFISDDGLAFRYDGMALPHDSVACSLSGTGIENVAIVPRSDGPGWRMYYAAGSNDCYGWQVLSATSDDERTWVPEPGVRLSNGGPIPPASPQTPPWPAGEGIVAEQLPSGDWHMVVSTYEHILPRVDKWQITEWVSTDQLNWNYLGVVLRTDSMPPAGQSSIYSPTIREFAPGLWRMIFTADNRGTLNWRSALWSAVSTDKTHWQVEDELIGAVGSNIYYAALAGARLVFVRQDAGHPPGVAIATIDMP